MTLMNLTYILCTTTDNEGLEPTDQVFSKCNRHCLHIQQQWQITRLIYTKSNQLLPNAMRNHFWKEFLKTMNCLNDRRETLLQGLNPLLKKQPLSRLSRQSGGVSSRCQRRLLKAHPKLEDVHTLQAQTHVCAQRQYLQSTGKNGDFLQFYYDSGLFYWQSRFFCSILVKIG